MEMESTRACSELSTADEENVKESLWCEGVRGSRGSVFLEANV